MDSTLLRTFRVVCEAGRISAAARALHLSQPAVSQQIHRLEESTGRVLLQRSARGVTPTAAGATLLGWARRLDALLEEAAVDLGRDAPARGELRLAASTTLASFVLPRLFARFRAARAPALPIRLVVGNSDAVLEQVRAGDVALGLIEGSGRAPHLHTEPFFDDEIVACVAADPSRLAFAAPRTPAALGRAPLVFRERGSGTREVVERALRRLGVRRAPGVADVELGSTEACKGAVEAGLGVGFLSRVTIEKELALGTLRPVEIRGLAIRRTFRWAMASPTPPGGAAGLFYQFAREVHAVR